MKRVLFKRFPREIKKNFFRYFSLLLLIIACMFLVVAIVDSAYTIIEGTKRNQEASFCEDCQATTFTALTKDQIKQIEDKGVTVEEHFSFDITLEDGSVLRVFKDRKKVDLVVLDEGSLPETNNDIVLLNRYCAEHDLYVGDEIKVDGKIMTITGFGSSVDYDSPVRKLSDTAVDSVAFGTAFVTPEAYDELKNSPDAGTEEYTYGFLLNDKMTADELKDMIKDFEFDYKLVKNPYYQEMLADTYGKRDEIEDGINDLVDGVDELYDGVGELCDGVDELKDGTEEFKDGMSELYDGGVELSKGCKELKDGTKEFDDGVGELKDGTKKLYDGVGELKNGTSSLKGGLDQLNEGAGSLNGGLNELNKNNAALVAGADSIFSSMLLTTQNTINEKIALINLNLPDVSQIPALSLTKENYGEQLTQFALMLESFGMADAAGEIRSAKGSLDGLANYAAGVKAYTDGVGKITAGSSELQKGTKAAADGAKSLDDGAGTLQNGTKELDNGVGELKDASKKLDDGAKELYDGSVKLKDGIKEAYDGSVELDDGVGELQDGTNELYDGVKELKDGVKDLKDQSDEMMDKLFSESPNNLTSFMLREENIRIGAAAGDLKINNIAGMVAGVVILILITYVLSVFVIHQIQKECTVIGALYSLGATKNDLIMHYVFIPTFLAFVGGVIGGVLGMSEFGCRWQMQDTYLYYSIPDMPVIAPLYLVLYSVVMPPVVAFIVNFVVINKSLSRTALSLLRNEQKITRGKDIKIGNMPFIAKYRLRQILRERRTVITVTFGMVISLFIFMLGMDCYVLCKSIGDLSYEDTKYNYMYTYKYPTEDPPENAEPCFVTSLKKEKYGFALDITIMGIDDDNPYFDVETVKGKNKVIIADAVAKRYKLKVGDKLILSDNAEDMDYAFTVEGIVPYSVGLTVFMDIESMRELFGEEDDYYNVVLSDEILDIDEGRLYSITKKSDIEKSSEVFVDLMRPMFVMMIGMSSVIFCIVMFLMMSVMIDRAGFGISLLKVLGYRTGEIKKLYLDGNRIMVILSAIISIPLSKFCMDELFPIFLCNVACAMHLEFKWYMYVAIFAVIMLLYDTINLILTAKLNRVDQNEVLKNRE